MANGQAIDVEINNNSGTVMTISFIGATLPADMDGTIPLGGVAVFSFKHFGGANARVTKVIF